MSESAAAARAARGPVPFAAALARARARVDAVLSDALREDPGFPLIAAMRHALHGGKALRGFLVIEGARLHAIDGDAAAPAAAAVEAIHAYSLVHDDLPCMDDDDLRRGQPTVHRKWDEATAVLAGDALQALAFELICRPGGGDHALPLAHGLARAAGHAGMVGGQMRDIAAETRATPASLAEITRLQRGKTGALLEWSATAGAVMAGADPAPLARYGQAIGLAFQIADDLLDVEGDAATLGKATGKDDAAGKATFVSHLGVEGAKARAGHLAEDACDALSCYGAEAETLKECARFIVTRDK